MFVPPSISRHGGTPSRWRRVVVLLGFAVLLAGGFLALHQPVPGPLDVNAPQRPLDPRENRWTNSVGMEFVQIPAGTFTMGSVAIEASSHDTPAHLVTISRSFSIGTTEVTQAQWRAVVGTNPSRFAGDDLPVEGVSWEDVHEFIRLLNTREDTTRYRLPTEAEWEYACKAGATGDETGDLASVAWYAPHSEGTTHVVGRKVPNSWGLHDTLGNVYEWCEDWKGDYSAVHQTDPIGPAAGFGRVVRGGSWSTHANRVKPTFRDHLSPDERRSDVGFRVAADTEGER